MNLALPCWPPAVQLPPVPLIPPLATPAPGSPAAVEEVSPAAVEEEAEAEVGRPPLLQSIHNCVILLLC